jgi:hypothetical protein
MIVWLLLLMDGRKNRNVSTGLRSETTERFNMTAYIHSDPGHGDIPERLGIEKCFYCGNPLKNDEKDTGGFIIWFGAMDNIALHQCCAEKLGSHLMNDARSLSGMIAGNCGSEKSEKIDTRSLWYCRD